MPNWNSVKRQLKFDKPRYLFTKTHKPNNENTNVLRQKQCIIYIFYGENTIVICNNGLNYLL